MKLETSGKWVVTKVMIFMSSGGSVTIVKASVLGETSCLEILKDANENNMSKRCGTQTKGGKTVVNLKERCMKSWRLS